MDKPKQVSMTWHETLDLRYRALAAAIETLQYSSQMSSVEDVLEAAEDYTDFFLTGQSPYSEALTPSAVLGVDPLDVMEGSTSDDPIPSDPIVEGGSVGETVE